MQGLLGCQQLFSCVLALDASLSQSLRLYMQGLLGCQQFISCVLALDAGFGDSLCLYMQCLGISQCRVRGVLGLYRYLSNGLFYKQGSLVIFDGLI